MALQRILLLIRLARKGGQRFFCSSLDILPTLSLSRRYYLQSGLWGEQSLFLYCLSLTPKKQELLYSEWLFIFDMEME
jgi:hypothetical protein